MVSAVTAMIVSDSLRVLLVEDDDDLVFLYRQKLEHDEYQVDVARDEEQALRMASGAAYDLIFLDIRLRQADGFAVLENLRSRGATRQTPVVVLSNLGTGDLRARGRRLGALEVLIKSAVVGGARAGFTSYAQAG